MKTSHKLLLAASLAAVLALAGCDADGDGYDDQTGEPVGVIPTRVEPEDYPDRDTGQPAATGPTCDPQGFGFLSGCGNQDSTPVQGAPAQAENTGSDDPCPPEWGATINPDGEIDFSSPRTFGIETGSECEAHIERQRRDFHQKFDDEFSRIVEEHQGGAS